MPYAEYIQGLGIMHGVSPDPLRRKMGSDTEEIHWGKQLCRKVGRELGRVGRALRQGCWSGPWERWKEGREGEKERGREEEFSMQP